MKMVVLGAEHRRRLSLRDKLQIVEETMQPGVVTVTGVARRHGLAPSCRLRLASDGREGRLGDAGPSFMPVEITPVVVASRNFATACLNQNVTHLSSMEGSGSIYSAGLLASPIRLD
jgi:transposase-like protein